MRKILNTKTKERIVDEILFDPESWGYKVAWGYKEAWENKVAFEFFNAVNNRFANNKDFKEQLIYTHDSLNFYIIYPISLEGARESKYFCQLFAYSLILGYFIIKDKGRKYKFYGSPDTLYQIIENFYRVSFPYLFPDDDDAIELLYNIRDMIDLNIIDYSQKQNNIESGFCCQGCHCRMDENSFSAIVDSNPSIENFIEARFINCPMCGSEIPLNKKIKDMLCSYEIIYKYHCFLKQELDNEFQLKFIHNLLFNKEESGFLKNLELEKISDPLCRELFGISKVEFERIWDFFSADIESHVYHAVDKFIFYEDIPKHAEYIESKRVEALRYMRRKKLKRMAEISKNLK